MIIADVKIEPYSLLLKRPWMMANGTRINRREGWLVKLTTDEGVTGTGDCAPFQVMGSESHQLAQQAVNDLPVQFIGEQSEQLLKNLNKLTRLPATRFAFESALLDLQARQQQKPLYATLGGSGDSIRISANAGTLQSNSLKAIKALHEEGFSTIKLKVGFQSVQREIQLLHGLSQQLPEGCQLRLDANRCWDMADAMEFVSQTQGLPVDCLEEPLNGPNLQQFQQLQQHASYDIALDESLLPLLRLYPFHAIPCRRLVIKPTILGGITPAIMMVRHAQSAGIRTMVTSTLESACGLYCAAHVAALSDELNWPMDHGLATCIWFEDDTGIPPAIINGELKLGNLMGSGFEQLP